MAVGIDLSTATKLRNMVLECETLQSGRAAITLKAITSKHRDLRQVSICLPSDLAYISTEYFVTVEQIENATPGTRAVVGH